MSACQLSEPLVCRQSNPEIAQYTKAAGLQGMAALEAAFEERVLQLTSEAGRAYIIWQDVVDNGVQVQPAWAQAILSSMVQEVAGLLCIRCSPHTGRANAT